MDLFGRAKKAMGGFAAPPPVQTQYYRIPCPDGHLVEGRRTDSYQAIRCPDCGEGVFVLPASPFPEPKLPANRAARPARSIQPDLDEPIPLADADPIPIPRDGEPVDTVEWVDEEDGEAFVPEPEPAPPADPAAPVAEFDPDLHLDEPETPRPAPSRQPQPAASSPAAKKPKSPRPAPVAVPEPRVPLKARLWRHRNALLLIAVIAIIGAAVANRLWRQKLAEMPKVYERGKTEGLAALDRGDFVAAKEILRDAAEAIRLLGGSLEDPDVEAVTKGAEEAAIYADLVRLPLDELVEKRSRAKTSQEWDGEFNTYHKGQSIVVQANVIAVPEPGASDSGYEIDYRIGFGGGPNPAGRGRIDLRGFRLVEAARPAKGNVLTFGARLEAIDFDASRNEYVVKLQPDSGVFLGRQAPLDAIDVRPHAEEDER